MIKSHTSALFARVATWALVLVLGLGTAGASYAAETAESKGELFGSVPVPAGLSKTAVQDAIVAVLLGRQWGVQSKDDGVVVGYLKHRSNEATVTLTYDTSKVDIYCVGYEIDKKTGVRKKPEQPKGWLKNIQGDLVKNFNRAATVR
jgi:hypothetical protein